MMQKKELLRKSAVLFFCILILVVTACDKLPFGYTKIGDIVKNPAAFDGKEKVTTGIENSWKDLKAKVLSIKVDSYYWLHLTISAKHR